MEKKGLKHKTPQGVKVVGGQLYHIDHKGKAKLIVLSEEDAIAKLEQIHVDGPAHIASRKHGNELFRQILGTASA